MKQRLLLVFLLLGINSFAAQVASVDRSLFQQGNHWTWLYSSWDGQRKEWIPYYIERYTVTKEDESRITIEMSSWPAPLSGAAHHKFILDFGQCERAARDPRFKNFTVRLFTKSLGSNWELVSNTHKNLIFTEKFNCTAAFPKQKVVYDHHSFKTRDIKVFQILTQPPRPGSWYFLSDPQLKGVAARKFFHPKKEYKFELIDFAGSSSILK